MIVPIHGYYVICDKCGEKLDTNAATKEIARESAIRKGWQVLGLMNGEYEHWCPKCWEKMKGVKVE